MKYPEADVNELKNAPIAIVCSTLPRGNNRWLVQTDCAQNLEGQDDIDLERENSVRANRRGKINRLVPSLIILPVSLPLSLSSLF